MKKCNKHAVILFFCEAEYIADFFLPLAKGLNAKYSQNRIVFVDTASVLLFDWEKRNYQSLNSIIELYHFKSKNFELEIFRFFQEHHIQLVVLPHELGINNFVVHLSKFFNIKTLHIQHGIFNLEHFNKPTNKIFSIDLLRFASNFLSYFLNKLVLLNSNLFVRILNYVSNKTFTIQKRPLNSDLILVFSEFYFNFFLNLNVNADRLKVVGNLYYSQDRFMWPDFNFDIYRKLRITKKAYTFTYIFSPFDEEPNVNVSPIDCIWDVIDALNNLIGKLNYTLIILVHPRIKFEFFNEILHKNMGNVTLTYSGDFFLKLVSISDILFGVRSGSFLDSLLRPRPIVLQSYAEIKPWKDLLDFNAAISVSNQYDLSDIISSILYSDKNEKCNLQESQIRCFEFYTCNVGQKVVSNILQYINISND